LAASQKGDPPAAPSAAKPAVKAGPPTAAAVAAAPVPAGGKMPRKFKVPVAPPATARSDGGDKAPQRVKRDHIPQWEKRKWQTAQSLFYPYDKIKSDFELQGLFTRMKDKCWMVIYFDMILMYLPTKEGPPDMEDKYEGKPFQYFFIDNIVDSDKIVADEAKLSIFLPTQNSKDDLRIICDSPQQFKVTIEDVLLSFSLTRFLFLRSGRRRCASWPRCSRRRRETASSRASRWKRSCCRCRGTCRCSLRW
jgi:hypothetical protein